MYRFVLFISCLYGGKIDSYLNHYMRYLCEKYPDAAETFQIPNDISAMFFTMTYEFEYRLATDLLEAIPNTFVSAIFVYDREMCILNVHKGDGDVDSVVEDHIADMIMQYESAFEDEFEYIDTIDQRRGLSMNAN